MHEVILPALLALVSLPSDWIQVPAPDRKTLQCANNASDEWRVRLGDKGVEIVKAARETGTGPALPFAIEREPGRLHVGAVEDGYLVGRDGGEWGGSLWWYGKDGQQRRKLDDEHVQSFASLGGEILAIGGLNHLGLRSGRVRWLARDAKQGWKVTATAKLDAGPQAVAETKEAVWVLTATSLQRVGRDHIARVVQPVPTGLLYPESLVAAPTGELLAGMRHFVVRFAPAGAGRFALTWFVRKGCEQVRSDKDGDCVCVGAGKG